MELKWTSKALSDLARLYDFLVLASKPAAARMVQSLIQAPVILLTHPRMGEQLFQFEPREVRRIFAGEYIDRNLKPKKIKKTPKNGCLFNTACVP